MTLYHTSLMPIDTPDTRHSRTNLDFGKGFYLTPLREQAVRYAGRFANRRKEAWLNIYELCEEWRDWNVKTCSGYNEEWLDFVTDCRLGKDTGDYDMVVGGVANDNVFETVDLYFSGAMTKERALQRLAFEHPNIQYCIRSEQMLRDCLTFKEAIKL
ncbi:MAG: DUF3990 domain-containing protein [Prevotellaceae bacterium]|nr:DUF3990 domain-containing protein [Prevotellaceae bacterium]